VFLECAAAPGRRPTAKRSSKSCPPAAGPSCRSAHCMRYGVRWAWPDLACRSLPREPRADRHAGPAARALHSHALLPLALCPGAAALHERLGVDFLPNARDRQRAARRPCTQHVWDLTPCMRCTPGVRKQLGPALHCASQVWHRQAPAACTLDGHGVHDVRCVGGAPSCKEAPLLAADHGHGCDELARARRSLPQRPCSRWAWR